VNLLPCYLPALVIEGRLGTDEGGGDGDGKAADIRDLGGDGVVYRFSVGSIAAAGCARTPVALSASKLSKTRSRNLRIILLLPSPVPSPATELH
jgi:hypothetical protein